MAKSENQAILSQLGRTPKQIDRELRAFTRAAKVLSSHRPRLISEHPQQWVGIYDGRVRVSAKSLKALLALMKKRRLSPSAAIIRYIDKNQRKLIL